MAVAVPPIKINKVFKIVEYGYLPKAVMPPGPTLLPGQALSPGLLRPVQNVAICDLLGGYVPVFCTDNWQMVPSGFDSRLAQNQNLTLERARGIPLEMLGLDVMVWYAVPEAEGKEDFHEQKLAQPNSVEALSWLRQEEVVYRIFGGSGIRKGFAGQRAIQFIQRLYRRGAVKVTAVDVQRDQAAWVRKVCIERGLPEADVIEATDELIVELPGDPQMRAEIIKGWVATFSRKTWDVPVDSGQRYLYFRWE